MYSSLRVKLLPMVIATMCASACGATVRSYMATGVNFPHYQAYAWGVSDVAATGDPRLDGNRFFDEHVRARVDAELARRGFEEARTGQRADLVVHYHASMTQRIDLRAIDAQYSSVHDEDERETSVYDVGTLVIDLVDRVTNVVVWRGWAEGSLEGVIDRQESMEAQITAAVARILERLPRRSSQRAWRDPLTHAK